MKSFVTVLFGAALLLALPVAPTAGARAEPEPLGFATDPHVHDGRIVFAFRGDLWLVGIDGSDPRQLTRHTARDRSPRFSPDGAWIAFTSDRMGNTDVWVMPSSGGEPRQLTFHTGGDDVVTWTPDSRRVVFTTSRGPLMWDAQLYTVSLEGELPLPLPLGAAATGTYSSDGRYFAYNRKRYPDPKRNYRGSAAAEVWVADLENHTFQQLTNGRLQGYLEHAHDAYPLFGADGWIYFDSERDGVFNLWRVRPEAGQPVQVTFHDRGGIRFPSISPDGRTISYIHAFDIWTVDVSAAPVQPRRVPIDLGWVVTTNLDEFVSFQDTADHFAPSPRGDYLVVDYRGEIFIIPTEENVGERSRVTASAWREQGALYSPDGAWLAYLSDESGEEEVWLFEQATGQRRRLTEQASRKSLDQWAPDSERIYYSAEVSLFAVDAASGRTESVLTNPSGGYTLTHISPDSRWLVLHGSDDYQHVDVFLYDTTGKNLYNVTDHPARNYGGLLTPDGSRLIFLSNRDGGTPHLFSVYLTMPTEDPDDPRVRERRQREQRAAAGAQGRGGEEGQGGRETEFSLAIDLEDIGRRAVQLTSGSDGAASPFLSADGRTIFFVSGSGTNRGLYSIDLDGRNRRRVAEGPFQSPTPSADGRMLFFREQQRIFRMPLTGSSRTKTQIHFQISFAVDKRQEWRQMFEEFYRHWKYGYVEEDFLGLDWDAVRARYEPMVERIGHTLDFYQLAAEMLHEVPCSHSGISAPSQPGAGSSPYRTRYPGFEMAPAGGHLRVTHIYRDGPADKIWLDLKPGHYVLAIDGQPLTATTNYWRMLNTLLNEYVTVTVADDPQGRNRRDLRINTVTNLGNIRYHDWVERNRTLVDSLSGGRIVYTHIRSMNQGSLNQFQQELDQYFYKEGMIIDVRYNGGGNIDQQLMDVLQRRPYQYTWTRTGSPLWGRRPQQIVYGPQVMMTNWRSGSNAEMVPHAFRHLELGTLVGTPTAGAVVSARSWPLLDGGSVRIPGVRVVSYDPEQPNNFGFSLENYGVPPDIWVRNSPPQELAGRDRELELAVQEALRMLESGRWQYRPDRD